MIFVKVHKAVTCLESTGMYESHRAKYHSEVGRFTMVGVKYGMAQALWDLLRDVSYC